MSEVDVDRLQQLLGRLEAHWRDQGAPIARHLRPGLAPEEMDQLIAPTGLTIPDELRIWWGWHDGADEGGGVSDARVIGPAYFDFLPLKTAIEAFWFNREVHAVPPDWDHPELRNMFWHESWLPVVTQDAQRLYVDTAGLQPGQTVPVKLVAWEWEGFDVEIVPSFTDAVALWDRVLTEGHRRWDGTSWVGTTLEMDVPLPQATIT